MGRPLGLWFSILTIAGFIPCIGRIAGLVALVLLILFLIKAFVLKKQLLLSKNRGVARWE